MHKTFDEVLADSQRRKDELLAEINSASPERKRELLLEHTPFASFVNKHRKDLKNYLG